MNNDNQARWQKREAELDVNIVYHHKGGYFEVTGNHKFYNGINLIYSRLGENNRWMRQDKKTGRVFLIWEVKMNTRNKNRINRITAMAIQNAHKTLHEFGILIYGEGLPEDINTRVTYTEA